MTTDLTTTAKHTAEVLSVLPHDRLPYPYGTLSYVSPIVIDGIATYQILVELLALPLEVSSELDILIPLDKAYFEFNTAPDEKKSDVVTDVTDGQTHNAFQTDQTIVMYDGEDVSTMILATITLVHIDKGKHLITLHFEDRSDMMTAIQTFHNPAVNSCMYRVRRVGVEPETIRMALLNMHKTDDVFPARTFGPISKYEKAYAIGTIVCAMSIMLGSTALIVQPDFYDIYHWKPTDPIFCLLTLINNDTTIATINQYEIQFIPEEQIPEHDPDVTRAVFFAGNYSRSFSDPFYVTIVISASQAPKLRIKYI